MYSTALNRYLNAAKSIEMSWFDPALGKVFKMGKTAIITPPAGVEEKEAEKMIKDRIIKTYLRHIRLQRKNYSGT